MLIHCTPPTAALGQFVLEWFLLTSGSRGSAFAVQIQPCFLLTAAPFQELPGEWPRADLLPCLLETRERGGGGDQGSNEEEVLDSFLTELMWRHPPSHTHKHTHTSSHFYPSQTLYIAQFLTQTISTNYPNPVLTSTLTLKQSFEIVAPSKMDPLHKHAPILRAAWGFGFSTRIKCKDTQNTQNTDSHIKFLHCFLRPKCSFRKLLLFFCFLVVMWVLISCQVYNNKTISMAVI